MSVSIKNWNPRDPIVLFCVGLAAVMLSFVVAIPPVWNAFMIPWRAEAAASVFLLIALFYVFQKIKVESLATVISKQELLWIILPMALFIVWSGLSTLWATSKASAIHHTTVWTEYLVFYLFVRYLIARPGGYGKLILTVSLTLSFLAILCVAAYCSYMAFGRGTSLGVVYAKYGEQVNTIFPLLAAGVATLKGKHFAFWTGVLTLLWLFVFATHSRAGITLFLLSFALFAALCFLIKRFRKYRIRAAIIGLLFLLAPLSFSAASYIAGGTESPTLKRLSNETELDDSNSFRKLMVTLSLEMFRSAPATGIGADNFGFAVNRYRSVYGSDHPDYEPLAQSENAIPERAHNEYLQIAAELGIVGVAIFAWFLLGIAGFAVKTLRQERRISLHHLAVFMGLGAFLVSSLVSSYSFRLLQNGFVFFFVLAVAVKLTHQKGPNTDANLSYKWVPRLLKPAMVAGVTACVALLAITTIRVLSVAFTTKANGTRDLSTASKLYETAMRLDRENPDARYFYGLRSLNKGDYVRAAELLQESINIGRAPSADFSYLASAQELSGNAGAAETTFAAATKMYPLSPFVLTRHAVLLKKIGDETRSETEFARALKIDPKQANSWWVMISVSPQAATDRSIRDKNFAALMDLYPRSAMHAVKTEREILHPEEKFFFGDNPF